MKNVQRNTLTKSRRKYKTRKYRKDILYDRYSSICRKIRRLGLRRGIDFGCGHCAMLILGPYFNIKIKGIDKAKNSFNKEQHRLKKMGYIIHHVEPNDIRYEMVLDNSQDFVMATHSIGAGLGDRTVEERVGALLRLIHPGGYLLLSPRSHFRSITNNATCVNYAADKSITITVIHKE